MLLPVLILLGAFGLVDSGSFPKDLRTWNRDCTLGFALNGPVSCGEGAALLRKEAAFCAWGSLPQQMRSARPFSPRNPTLQPSMTTETADKSLYGPVVVQDPETSKPLIRVSRTTDAVDELEGCTDVKLVNTIGWGDGHHATTRLCLDFLARHAKDISSQSVLDYGTGSGVLGITARKLGCESVIGVDIDDEAIDAAYENLAENNIDEETMTLCHTREIVQDLDGIQLRDEPSRAALKFDLVIANILIGPLMKLAPVLSLCMKDDTGLLCLSGLREEQLPALEAEYAKFGVQFVSVHKRRHDQWREGAEGEGVWAQVTARKRQLSDAERKALLDELNDRAVS